MRIDEVEEALNVGFGDADRVGRPREGGVGRAQKRVPAPGQDEEMPALGRDRQRVAARHGLDDQMDALRAQQLVRGGPSQRRSRKRSDHGPAASTVSLARTSKRAPLKASATLRALDAAVADQKRLGGEVIDADRVVRRRPRPGIPAPAARAHTSARRNRGRRPRSLRPRARVRASSAALGFSQAWPGRRWLGSSSQPRS